ncbi:asparagine synthase C-terminal domain-containing protein [Streptomyces sp. NPDC041068]|uniref:asparagine synthase C-terminal domain-containing protein n=1 Tax=Streptomyces sp. NPDC041068 TaxID=3155130 RepID=UPI0033FF2CD2
MDSFPSLLLDIRNRPGGGLETRLGTAGPRETGRLVVEELDRSWPLPSGGADSCNTIEWTGDRVVVRTSRQNPTILYYWAEPGADRVLIGTDLAEVTARVLTDFLTDSGPEPDRARRQARAVRDSVRKIGGGRIVTFARASAGTAVEVTEQVAQTWHASPVIGETAMEAGDRQIEILCQEIVTAGEPGPVTAVVSGGVDSGLVAALAKEAGILDHLATLGTPWGNEYAAADELGAHLGMPVQHLDLSEEDILRAIPETVRMLGRPSREAVAGGVNLVAVYQQGRIPRGTVLTGVGADFINSGLRVEAGPVPDLRKAVRECLEGAALAGELSGISAAAHGYVLRHMYWNTPVIQAALDTVPGVMRHRDREKGHMRLAATRILPDAIAWRPKQALHHGSGVEANLDGAVARLIGVPTVDVERFYDLVGLELVEALAASPHEPVDSDKCLEAAISAYNRANRDNR